MIGIFQALGGLAMQSAHYAPHAAIVACHPVQAESPFDNISSAYVVAYPRILRRSNPMNHPPSLSL